MSSMFYECGNLNYLNLSNFNTKNVTNMSYMFYKCNNLDLSSFNTDNATNMNGILYGCPDNIYELNKSKFKNVKKEKLTNL